MKSKISSRGAMAVVIANMIGTGVFTSLGFQLVSTKNTWSIILLWSLGAIMAISGALSYAELGTKLTRSGGEYHFLSVVYNKFAGYLSGWASLTVGFAAPIALAAMAAGAYTEKYFGINDKLIASILIVVVSLFHMFNLKRSSQFQNTTTFIKILVIFIFISIGLFTPSETTSFDWSNQWQNEILLPSFAVSLVYVSYSFSGWNAAAYIVDEIKNVNRNLPIALIGGTLLVSVFYILLQIVFLKQAPLSLLVGQVEIGQIVADNIFGSIGGKVISGLIAFMLVSSISAMVWVGPRVTKAMAEDYLLWKFLSKTNKNGIPNKAIILQAIISLTMVFTGSFDQILTYSAFILQLFVSLTVLSLFFIRKNDDLSGYKSPLFPLPQIIFLLISLWILIYLLVEQPVESLIGIGILLLGELSFLFNKAIESKKIKT
ncbi:APC family permease [Tenacibaculum aiptasiae]|uniref:APC family permease n=1 Tax=Tenacibaculum aiptasiae TaxID=426481 RepID=UPI003B5BA41B